MKPIMHAVPTAIAALALALLTSMHAYAAENALGYGLIAVPPKMSLDVDSAFIFKPKFSRAYRAAGKGTPVRWLLLTEKDPASVKWRGQGNMAAALTAWCKNSDTPLVLAELNEKGEPELLTACAAKSVGVEMISTINGLASVQVHYQRHEANHLKGELLGGIGWCGEGNYCEPTKFYRFDSQVSDLPKF
jgi:hypothetical protein